MQCLCKAPRGHSGLLVTSVRTRLQNKGHMIESLCRVKFKLPGHQKIHISKKQGITEFNVKECGNMVEEWLIPGDRGVRHIPNHGPSGQMASSALVRALVLAPPY